MSVKSAICHRAALAAAAVLVSWGGAAFAKPQGVTYMVHVGTSFGTQFKDCFAFDTAGALTVSGYGTLAYTPGGRGSSLSKFQAVSPLAVATTAGFTLELSGIALGNATSGAIKGSGSNENGDAFNFHGFPDASCSVAAAVVSPYLRQ